MPQTITFSGQRRRRVRFAERAQVADGYGNTEGHWTEQFELWARIMPIRGGEDVLAMRLTGVQPVIITVQFSTKSQRITPGWHAVDSATGTEYDIQTVANTDERKHVLEMLASTGGAVG